MSGQSFKLDDKDEDDDDIYHDALASAPNKHGDEESNPYLKDINNKSSTKKSLRKLSKEERKSKPAASRKDSIDVFGDESESISKLADQRVSNAVTISNKLTSKMKDKFIKKILKEGEEEAIPEEEESAVQQFDLENQATRVGDQIEMTRQTVTRSSDPLLNPLLELDDQRIQG